jgi:type II secretory pathway component PulF
MANYSYKARNNTGALVEGDLIAASEQEAMLQLRKMEYTPVKITQAKIEKSKQASNFLSMNFLSLGSPKIKVRDMLVLCTNLSSMTSAGIPLLNALNMVGGQLPNAQLATVVRKVTQMVSEGSSFSEALAVYPEVFSNFFVNMIRAAEISGTMDQVLKELAVYLEKQDFISRLRGSCFIDYPCCYASICADFYQGGSCPACSDTVSL